MDLNISFDMGFDKTKVFGVSWESEEAPVPMGAPTYAFPVCKVVEIYISIIPCFPIIIQIAEDPEVVLKKIGGAYNQKENDD